MNLVDVNRASLNIIDHQIVARLELDNTWTMHVRIRIHVDPRRLTVCGLAPALTETVDHDSALGEWMRGIAIRTPETSWRRCEICFSAAMNQPFEAEGWYSR